MYKFKLKTVHKDGTVEYSVYQFSLTEALLDTLFILVTFGFGLISFIQNRVPIGYKYIYTIRGISKNSIKNYIKEKLK